ncbi:hypothetical protein EVAR_91504_1 [Eumeta japonica]|uniref:Uncharacterized protein n=1 Tax=Eumeta variegata TaxID=151549 RepID=A0A4C1VBF4_EUMVA|nr:hypothetical protein EVAR_91504_1 [Eumeta japonica]
MGIVCAHDGDVDRAGGGGVRPRYRSSRDNVRADERLRAIAFPRSAPQTLRYRAGASSVSQSLNYPADCRWTDLATPIVLLTVETFDTDLVYVTMDDHHRLIFKTNFTLLDQTRRRVRSFGAGPKDSRQYLLFCSVITNITTKGDGSVVKSFAFASEVTWFEPDDERTD